MTNEVVRRVAPLMLLNSCVLAARAEAQEKSPPPVPLAYVRSLVVIPTTLTTPADPTLPPAPAASKKKEYARWQARFKCAKRSSP